MHKVAFDQLVAADIMQRDVLTIAPQETLRDALLMMTGNHVTGLPVMDEHGRCIGLISATDILNFEQDHADEEAESEMLQFYNPENEQWESVPASAFGLEEMGEVRVEEVMATDLIWVDRNKPLKEGARKMLDARIHRVLVMDDTLHLFGLVSSFDFVRVVAEK